MLFKKLTFIFGFVAFVIAEHVNVVFVGDSITQRWKKEGKRIFDERFAPLGVKNVARGGDKTETTIDRIDNQHLLDELQAKVAVLMIGTNNIYGTRDTEEEIARQIKLIVNKLREKLNAKVLLIGILPRDRIDGCLRIEKINSLISKYNDGEKVRFLDMTNHFETARAKLIEKLFAPDKGHLSEAGYKVWADLMEPLVKDMLK